ncbi:MAG: hypothetical protein J2P16_00140 [Mycobacterium sp.]|nr:hypothetical protein [Mycobacterium sp.]
MPGCGATRRNQETRWTNARTPEEWERARRIYGQGGSLNEIADELGVTRQAVAKQANRNGWERDDGSITKRDRRHEEALRETAQANRQAWAERRLEEANAAGLTAAWARSQIVQYAKAGDAPMTRACTIAYGVLIDKAQLLTGAATDRTDIHVREGLDAELERLASELTGDNDKAPTR